MNKINFAIALVLSANIIKCGHSYAEFDDSIVRLQENLKIDNAIKMELYGFEDFNPKLQFIFYKRKFNDQKVICNEVYEFRGILKKSIFEFAGMGEGDYCIKIRIFYNKLHYPFMNYHHAETVVYYGFPNSLSPTDKKIDHCRYEMGSESGISTYSCPYLSLKGEKRFRFKNITAGTFDLYRTGIIWFFALTTLPTNAPYLSILFPAFGGSYHLNHQIEFTESEKEEKLNLPPI